MTAPPPVPKPGHNPLEFRRQVLPQIEGDLQLGQGRSEEDQQDALDHLHQLWSLVETIAGS